jgi:hypothetical protein
MSALTSIPDVSAESNFPPSEDTHHSPGVVAKQEYLKAVPSAPDKVVRMTILEIPPGRVVGCNSSDRRRSTAPRAIPSSNSGV